MKKAELAVDAGVDAIMWDNMIGYHEGLAQLLDDTQRMAERKAQQTGRPKVMVSANIHIPPDRFGMNDINEAIWEEDGKDTPGVWDGKWQVGNARKIKFLNGEKQLWQPLKYENDLYHCGPRERCIPSPAEQKLSIAEAYAFGAATSRNIEGRFLSALIKGEPEALEAWAAIAEYNHFLVEHSELYHQVSPAANVSNRALCSALSLGRSAGITRTLNRSRGTPLSRCASTLVSKKTLCLRNSSASGLCGSAEIKAICAAGAAW